MRRLPPRSARRLEAVNLEEANESGGAGEACDQLARDDDRAPRPAEFPGRGIEIY